MGGPSGKSGKPIRDVPCSSCGALMLRSRNRKGTECGTCVTKHRTNPSGICTGCGGVLKYDKRRKGTQCRPCVEKERTLPDRFCTECGKKISKRMRGTTTTLCRSHAAKSEERIEKLRVSMRVVHADPEYQSRRGRAVSNAKLADIPYAYRADYRRLMYSKGLRARECRRIVLEDAARAVATHNKKFNQE